MWYRRVEEEFYSIFYEPRWFTMPWVDFVLMGCFWAVKHQLIAVDIWKCAAVENVQDVQHCQNAMSSYNKNTGSVRGHSYSAKHKADLEKLSSHLLSSWCMRGIYSCVPFPLTLKRGFLVMVILRHSLLVFWLQKLKQLTHSWVRNFNWDHQGWKTSMLFMSRIVSFPRLFLWIFGYRRVWFRPTAAEENITLRFDILRVSESW